MSDPSEPTAPTPDKPSADHPAVASSDGAPAAPAGKLTLKQRLTAHFNEYGYIAVVTYFTLSILTIIGFSVAIGMGTSPDSTAGVFGVIIAGWVAAKATLPIRILITLAITPVVAVVVNRFRRNRPADVDTDDGDNVDPPA